MRFYPFNWIDMLIPRWRNTLTIKNLVASTLVATQFCSFHSTPTACEKWKKNWDSTFGKAEQRKSYIKYTTRQKRADTKKALKDLLYKSGSRSISFQDEDPLWRFDNKEDQNQMHNPGRKDGLRKGPKSHYKKMKRKMKKEDFEEEFGFKDDPETVFQATFGNRWYTWSVDPRYSSSDFNTSAGFEWRKQRVNSSWEEHRARKWSFIDEEEEFKQEEIITSSVGSSSDRTLLGLPPRGPLKLEEVKTAFRASALRWHPDKHQGPSQSVAEEKFKLCVTAYKSLCSALSSSSS